MIADAAETFTFDGSEGEVDFNGDGVEEGAEPELRGVGKLVLYVLWGERGVERWREE